MANERYMTPGSAVADKLQEILAQRRSDKQQQLLMSLQMAQAQQGWENQQTDNARLDRQLQDNMDTNAATRLAAEQQMAERTAESVGGGVDVARMNPTVAKRQQDFGYVTPLGMAAEGPDGPGQAPMMTSTAPSLLKKNAEMDLETRRRRALVDQMMLITDPREQAVFAESNGLKPVLQNYGRTFDSVTGKFGVPFKEGFGDGSTKTYEQRGFQPPTPQRSQVLGNVMVTLPDGTTELRQTGMGPDGEPFIRPYVAKDGAIILNPEQYAGVRNNNVSGGGASRAKAEAVLSVNSFKDFTTLANDKLVSPDKKITMVDALVRRELAENKSIPTLITLTSKNPDLNGKKVDARGAIRSAYDTWVIKQNRNPKRTPNDFLTMVKSNFNGWDVANPGWKMGMPSVWPPEVSAEDQAKIEGLVDVLFSYGAAAPAVKPTTSWFE